RARRRASDCLPATLEAARQRPTSSTATKNLRICPSRPKISIRRSDDKHRGRDFRVKKFTNWATKTSEVLTVLQHPDERAGAQFVRRQAGQPNRLMLGDGPAVDCAQEIVEKSLPRRRVVEYVADECGPRGLLDEVTQALRGGAEAFEEEGVDGCVARGQ